MHASFYIFAVIVSTCIVLLRFYMKLVKLRKLGKFAFHQYVTLSFIFQLMFTFKFCILCSTDYFMQILINANLLCYFTSESVKCNDSACLSSGNSIIAQCEVMIEGTSSENIAFGPVAVLMSFVQIKITNQRDGSCEGLVGQLIKDCVVIQSGMLKYFVQIVSMACHEFSPAVPIILLSYVEGVTVQLKLLSLRSKDSVSM